MTITDPVSARNLDGYGDELIDWTVVLERLGHGLTQAPDTGGPNRHTPWLTTIRSGGAPHTRPVGVVWVDGSFYFNSGDTTGKGRNLSADSRCSLAVATHEWDLVVEGRAERVTDRAELERVADAFRDGGWEPEVRDGALHAEFSAPSAGPPPWYLYRVEAEVVYAFGTAPPFGATRWQFT
ncbi:MAG: pyridoxamine 5'-phosphate oxidase family protein [Acidimicrobiales bacterium]